MYFIVWSPLEGLSEILDKDEEFFVVLTNPKIYDFIRDASGESEKRLIEKLDDDVDGPRCFYLFFDNFSMFFT